MTEATIFITALDKPTKAERAAFLAEACGGDERLRRRIEALLRAHAEPDDILDPTEDRLDLAWSTIPALTDADPAGAIVNGRYKLLELIGEGGMGTVWMAEQRDPVKRLVALKLIKPGMDSKAVLARFEAERQALALMDHPNIARILDGGTTRDEPGGVGPGRPYFVMELVKGQAAHGLLRCPPAEHQGPARTLCADLLCCPARASKRDHPPRLEAEQPAGHRTRRRAGAQGH